MKRKVLFADTDRCSSKLTLRLINEFCYKIADGHPADAVCDYLEVSPSSYYNWLRKGAAQLEMGKTHRKEAIFVTRFRKALAIYRMQRVDDLHEPTNRNWRKELAILERRDRRTFGRNEIAGGSDETFNQDERFL